MTFIGLAITGKTGAMYLQPGSPSRFLLSDQTPSTIPRLFQLPWESGWQKPPAASLVRQIRTRK